MFSGYIWVILRGALLPGGALEGAWQEGRRNHWNYGRPSRRRQVMNFSRHAHWLHLFDAGSLWMNAQNYFNTSSTLLWILGCLTFSILRSWLPTNVTLTMDHDFFAVCFFLFAWSYSPVRHFKVFVWYAVTLCCPLSCNFSLYFVLKLHADEFVKLGVGQCIWLFTLFVTLMMWQLCPWKTYLNFTRHKSNWLALYASQWFLYHTVV